MNIFREDEFDFLDKKTRKILMESQESFIPHTPYAYERNLLEAVREGEWAKAKACDYLLGTTGKSGILSDNPLRQEQIMFIAFITQITRAAIDGGVSENLAFAMSDSYIQTSEKCTDIKQIQVLHARSLKDFVNAVKYQKESPPYSRAVRKAITYMRSHMQEKITIEILAKEAGLSVGRFSHLFCEETGESPIAYFRKEKLESAKNMLLYSEYNVSEISAILGFSSESHFIKAFRAYTGKTPGVFKNS